MLTCIANLSNDEVFTPPEFANRILDTLAEAWAADNGGANIWADLALRFLDPCTKSGVFLREITSRLTAGLADEIPNLDERVNHILTKQVFGIGTTYLTSLLARRSVYCSKHAKGAHSVAKGFASDAGNIWFERTEHTRVDGRCNFCGASKKTLDRGEGLETHAYAFIHTDEIRARVACRPRTADTSARTSCASLRALAWASSRPTRAFSVARVVHARADTGQPLCVVPLQRVPPSA